MKRKIKSKSESNPFKKHEGRASFDMPQPLWALHDYDEVELLQRDGKTKVKQIFEINWKATFKKKDIVGWRMPLAVTTTETEKTT